MASWRHSPLTFGLLLCCTLILISQCADPEDMNNLDKVQNLLKTVEFHRDNYHQSLRDLNQFLTQFPEAKTQLLKPKKKISKRSEVSQLFTSFLAFCESLKNKPQPEPSPTPRPEQTSNMPTTTVAKEDKANDDKAKEDKAKEDKAKEDKAKEVLMEYPRIWHELNNEFNVFKLKARRISKDRLLVVASVEHSVPVYAYTFLNPDFPVYPRNVVLLPNKKPASTTSNVRFRIDMNNCKFNNSDGSKISLIVSGITAVSPAAGISIQPCDWVSDVSKWKEYDIKFSKISWTLQRNVLITDASESNHDTKFEVRMMKSKSQLLAITATQFDKSTGSLGVNLDIVFGSYDIGHKECPLSRYRIDVDRNNSIYDLHLCYENETSAHLEDSYNNQTDVKLIVDTSVRFSGVIEIGQTLKTEVRGSLISATRYSYPLVVTADEDNKPFPDGKIAFRGPQEFLCNTNPFSTVYTNICRVSCHARANNIQTISITKDQNLDSNPRESINTDTQVQIIEHQGLANLYLSFKTMDPENEGRYICKVTTKEGITAQSSVNLKVGGMPNIDDDDFYINIRGRMAEITCKATGSDLKMSIKEDRTWTLADMGTEDEVKANVTIVVDRPSDNEAVITLMMSVNRLKQIQSTFLHCQAENHIHEATDLIYADHTIVP